MDKFLIFYCIYEKLNWVIENYCLYYLNLEGKTYTLLYLKRSLHVNGLIVVILPKIKSQAWLSVKTNTVVIWWNKNSEVRRPIKNKLQVNKSWEFGLLNSKQERLTVVEVNRRLCSCFLFLFLFLSSEETFQRQWFPFVLWTNARLWLYLYCFSAFHQLCAEISERYGINPMINNNSHTGHYSVSVVSK